MSDALDHFLMGVGGAKAQLSSPHIDALRDRAVAAFKATGLPTARTEAWKFTSAAPLIKANAAPVVTSADPETLPANALAVDCPTVVLVDGAISETLSTLDNLPKGLTVRSASAGDAGLGDLLPLEGFPFAALNTASFRDAVMIEVAAGQTVETPVHIVSLSTHAKVPQISHPRICIKVGKGAIAAVAESHIGEGGVSFANVAVEVDVADDAVLTHVKLQDESRDGFHTAMTASKVGEKATYENVVIQMGASLARNEIRHTIAGSHSESRLLGAYLGDGDQHLDNTTFVDHAVADTELDEVYKGVLAGKARGVFQGKILVRPDSQRTDGNQMSRALLLSDKAEANLKPELEIYADDVKCSHGATVGELEEDQLFYLQARGLSRPAARALLVDAFVMEIVDRISSTSLREAMADAVRAHFARMFK
ncbi:MAG: Fe-S cluster assembly protein SufD [Alphaproteobacteria bacterium]|nr:Fe-S cluster assembly protein SufD [Alphaproteobacteria bacterium]